MGPMNSRLRTDNLFAGCEFLFVYKFNSESISLAEIKELCVLNGAVVLEKAKEFTDIGETYNADGYEIKRIVLFDETVRPLSRAVADQMLTAAKAHCVNKTWMVDSLACFKLRNMDDYKTYDE
jgi:hypothetical protein